MWTGMETNVIMLAAQDTQNCAGDAHVPGPR